MLGKRPRPEGQRRILEQQGRKRKIKRSRITTTFIGKAAVQFGKPKEEPGIVLLKEVHGEEGKEKDTEAKVERIGSMEFLCRVVRRTEERGKQYLRTFGHPSFS